MSQSSGVPPTRQPRIMLCTIALNEIEWLDLLYRQHKDWPGLVNWCFVESADRVYAETNPDMVVAGGLSIDGTSNLLRNMADLDRRVTYVPFGLTTDPRPEQGKCQARQQYLNIAEQVKPDWLVVVDSDEFYTYDAQAEINRLIQQLSPTITGAMFKQRHIWKPATSPLSLFQEEVIGGYWQVPHLRVWRWQPGMSYKQNHNWPEDRHGNLLNRQVIRFNRLPNTPECIHLGYASSLKSRTAKHDYYRQRGEGGTSDRKRSYYLDCRNAWEQYQPGDQLPHGAQVIPYNEPIPEVFL